MVKLSGWTMGGLVLVTVMSGVATAADQQFSCKGQVVQGMPNPAVPPKPIDLTVTVSDKKKMSIKTGDNQTFNPHITSNNELQLKFSTKDFVGQYFYYTGDLFLIYNSRQLARLSCTRT